MIEKTVTAYRVTEAEVKKQLNIEVEHVEDDGYIKTLIEAATNYISGYICADVAKTNCVLEVEDTEVKIINNAPFLQLTKVTNSDNEDVTNDCKVHATYSAFTITFPEVGNYKIEWVSGYNNLPPALKQAIIIKAADLFDPERSSVVIGTIVSQTHLIPGLINQFVRSYWV
ncbi:head-tail connector protein [Carboxylicivirga marina]|uniref:Phage gp6-like head-tail connector protein n=1 Tax=Carboxylicivirga marina TaxID=2800988 RepID=A0ABS1HGD2_9BACT|nr:head-tail connector protein [Carboxylicivirga marina]MBK3516704.1 phage gp6-like head-tail connector protein [Carboxylicivirga marina]